LSADTSAPSDCSSVDIVRMSDSRGAFVSVSGSSDRSVAGISVRQAFFAPAIGICPDSGPLPVTTILIHVLPSPCAPPGFTRLVAPWSGAAARLRACAFRLAMLAFSADFSRASRSDAAPGFCVRRVWPVFAFSVMAALLHRVADRVQNALASFWDSV
jgi:hypothetical protein